MNKLRILKLNFNLEATNNFTSKDLMGNKLRGALGNSFVKLFCIHDAPDCAPCALYENCIYGDLFKPVEIHKDFTSRPSPFVIGINNNNSYSIRKGEELTFSITIFGKQVRWWNHIVKAVIDIFKNNSYIFNRSFKLVNISSPFEEKIIYKNNKYLSKPKVCIWSDNKELYKKQDNHYNDSNDSDISIRITFITPLITKDKSSLDWEFPEFMDAVFYRIASIIDVYEDGLFTIPYKLLYRKPYILSENRVKKDKCLSVTFRGNLKDYLTYIELGKQLHIGKKATYGFGEYSYSII